MYLQIMAYHVIYDSWVSTRKERVLMRKDKAESDMFAPEQIEKVIDPRKNREIFYPLAGIYSRTILALEYILTPCSPCQRDFGPARAGPFGVLLTNARSILI